MGPVYIVFSLLPVTLALNNGLGLKPPMGWDPWNGFHDNVTETDFYEIAQLIHTNGMQDVGYEYINFDGGWWQGDNSGRAFRNATGYLHEDPNKFPSGMKALADYVHSLGFKFGAYTSSGTQFCNKDNGASQGWEPQDLELFLSWDLDLLKLDACGSQIDILALVYTWKALLNATGRSIFFGNCQNDCQSDQGNNVHTWQDWCPELSNMWRTSKDLKATWPSILNNLLSLQGRGMYGAPGRWNDPDSLVINCGNFTQDEQISHFSLWCITSSPLVLGMDVRKMDQSVLEIVTNKEAIAINQDYKSGAGDRVSINGDTQVWAKNLTDGWGAVLLNTNDTDSKTVVAKWTDIGLPSTTVCQVRDIWKHVDVGFFSNNFTATLAPHAVFFAKLYQCQAAA